MKWLATTLNASGMRRVIPVLIALGASTKVLGANCHYTNNETVENIFYATTSIGRDVPIYTPLAAPKIINSRMRLSCYPVRNPVEVVLFRESELIPIASAPIGLVEHAIYPTDIPSIGLAVASRLKDGGWAKGYSASVSIQAVPSVADRVEIVREFEVSYTWVKIAPIMSGRYYPSNISLGRSGYTFDRSSIGSLSGSRVSGDITVSVQSCTVSDVTVDMGDQRSSDFDNPASMRDVRVRLHSCPPDLSTIKYIIGGRVLDPYNGTLGLDNSGFGSARGVILQLLKEDGVTPLELRGLGHVADAYNPATGADFEIRFKARYKRNGSVSGGAANASATITMIYQ